MHQTKQKPMSLSPKRKLHTRDGHPPTRRLTRTACSTECCVLVVAAVVIRAYMYEVLQSHTHTHTHTHTQAALTSQAATYHNDNAQQATDYNSSRRQNERRRATTNERRTNDERRRTTNEAPPNAERRTPNAFFIIRWFGGGLTD